MVRAYLPQTFPRTISTNSNYPGQGEKDFPSIPPAIEKELVEETLGVFDNMIFDIDGATDTGQVNILGG